MVRSETRYETIAERLERAVRTGAYAPGARLPSVRELCRTWQASVTTVVAAYHLLERRGVVVARAQSGHFAAHIADIATISTTNPRHRLVPTAVDLGELALGVMRDSADPGLAPFGPAMPDPELLPKRELARLLSAVAREGHGLDRYGIPPGELSLRTAVASHAVSIGCTLKPTDVVVTAGGLEALTLALRATCKAGQTVAIESPIYYGLLQSIEALGLNVIEIPRDPQTGLALEVLREALDEHPIAAVVAMPAASNPGGFSTGPDRVRDLVELLAARNVPLIEDDVMGDLAHDGHRPPPAKAFDRDGLVLWCSSLSKTAAPGLRIGWIAAGRFQAAIEHLQFTNAIGPSPFSQEVAARLMAGGGYQRILRRICPIYAARTAAMVTAVQHLFPPTTRVVPPVAGFCLWLELPSGVDSAKAYSAALHAGIAIIPGHLFSPKLRYRRCIRLCAARWDEQQQPALARLAKAIGKLVPTS